MAKLVDNEPQYEGEKKGVELVWKQVAFELGCL